MEDLNQLSNEELKYRLTQFGFANLPVTLTTRKVLIKKLRNHLENEKSKLKRETSYATRYSSDEDHSDADTSTIPAATAAARKRGALTRSTISSISQSNAAASSRSNEVNVTMPPPSKNALGLSTTKRTATTTTNWDSNVRNTQYSPQYGGSPSKPKDLIYISPLIQSTDRNGNESDEESDSNVNNASISNRYSGTLSMNISPRASIGGVSNAANTSGGSGSANGLGNFADLENTHYLGYGGIRNRFYNPMLDEHDSTVHSTTAATTNGVHEHDDASNQTADFTKRLLSFRNRNLGSTVANPPVDTGKRFDRYSSSTSATPSPIRTSHYLNDPAARLSNLSRDNIVYQARYSSSNQRTSQTGKDDRNYPLSISTAFSTFINRLDEQYGIKQTFVPCILLTLLFIFFAFVIIAYLTMSPDLSLSLDAKAAKYQLCPELNEIGFAKYQPSINCVEQSELEPAFDLLKILIPELQKRVEFNRCTDSSAVFAMNAKETTDLLLETHPESVLDTLRTLHNAEYLISMNPQWRVGHFRDQSAAPGTSITMTDVAKLRPTQSNYYAIVKPRLPVTCFLYNKLQTFFIIVGWIGITVLVGYVAVVVVKFIRSHLQTRRERLNNMIEDIINVLMEKAYDPDTAGTEAASVVVNHLREKLIPATERSRMESVWNAAIKYIEQNESRIQFSVATRNGEDYRVMRWMDTVSPNQQNSIGLSGSASSASRPSAISGGNMGSGAGVSPPVGPHASATGQNYAIKKWQSPAFDKTNKIKDPPTECLKIRQMFEKYEANNPNLKQNITDAILEKIAHTSCKIYDVELDKQSCCVYVRCATPADAGIIHDEINGWWFDSRLVSIKFLRLDRYLNRFPNSTSLTTVLKPSNTRNLSMTNTIDPISGDRLGNGKRGAGEIDDDDDEDDYYYNN